MIKMYSELISVQHCIFKEICVEVQLYERFLRDRAQNSNDNVCNNGVLKSLLKLVSTALCAQR